MIKNSAFLCVGLSLCGCQSSAPTSAKNAHALPRNESPAKTSPATPPTSSAVPPIASFCPSTTPDLDLGESEVSLVEVVHNHFEGFGNIEGPAWIGGALYYSNISGEENPPASVIYRWVPGETPELFLDDAGSNGLATDQRGRLYAATHSDGTLKRRNLDTPQRSEVLAGGYQGRRFNSPNDLVVANDGAFYFTDPVWQAPDPHPQERTRVYRVENSVAQPIVAFSELENPNGITLSLDESRLFVGGENGLFFHDLGSDEPARRVLTEHLQDTSGIDGLGRDCAGNVYVTVHAKRLVVILSPLLEELGTLAIPSAGGVTNVAFGGAERTTLYVTSLGEPPQLHEIQLNVPGYPY